MTAAIVCMAGWEVVVLEKVGKVVFFAFNGQAADASWAVFVGLGSLTWSCLVQGRWMVVVQVLSWVGGQIGRVGRGSLWSCGWWGVLLGVLVVLYGASSEGVLCGGKSGWLCVVVCCVGTVVGGPVDERVGAVVGVFVGALLWPCGWGRVGLTLVAMDLGGVGVRIGVRTLFQSKLGGRSSVLRKQSCG